MKISNGPAGLRGATVVVTGASRGLGLELALESVRRGAVRVVAGSRTPPPDGSGLEWVRLDLSDDASVERVARAIGPVDILVNNAGLGVQDRMEDGALLAQHLRVNLAGPHLLTELMLPHLRRSGGVVVNVLSLASIAPIPGMAAYSSSKAAAMSWTQTLRVRESGRVTVHAVYAGPIDTEMVRDLPVPKSPADEVARRILDATADSVLDVFPDPTAAHFADAWAAGPAVALERANAALVTALA